MQSVQEKETCEGDDPTEVREIQRQQEEYNASIVRTYKDGVADLYREILHHKDLREAVRCTLGNAGVESIDLSCDEHCQHCPPDFYKGKKRKRQPAHRGLGTI